MTIAPGARDHGGASEPCVMEHVSKLAGLPFGVPPRCTHPVVSAFAMVVHDAVSDDARVVLRSRGPALARARSTDPALTWRLVGRCTEATLRAKPDDPSALARSRRAARMRAFWSGVVPPALARCLPGWVLVGISRTALDKLLAALHPVIVRSGPAGSARRDAVLLGLLDDVVDLVLARAADGAPLRCAA